MAQFIHLPNEIMSEIFRYLTPQERQLQREVCKRWKENIDCIFGVTILFTSKNFEAAQRIDKSHVVGIVLKDLNKTVKKKMVHTQVQSISFVSLVWKRNLLGLLKALPNLTKLTFQVPSFINFRKLMPSKSFVFPPKLTELNLTFSVASINETKNYFLLLTFLVELGVLGKLRKLKILLIGEIDNFLIYSSMGPLSDKKDPIGQIILNNKETIRELELYNIFQIYSKEYYRDTKFAEVKVERLSVYEMDGRSSWTELFYGQNILKYLELKINLGMWYTNVIQGAICMSKDTLEDLRISIHKGSDPFLKHFVNLTFLIACTKLKTLSVRTSGLQTRQLYTFLPSSLVDININGLVDQDTLQNLFDDPSYFPNLKSFTLHRYMWWQWQPYPATQSLTAKTLFYIARQAKLTKINFFCCKMNMEQILDMLKYANGFSGYLTQSGDLLLNIDRKSFVESYKYYTPSSDYSNFMPLDYPPIDID